MKRALIFPSYMGNGFGHVARGLAIADELSRRDWLAALVLTGPHANTARGAGYRVFEPRLPTRPRFGRGEPPAYTWILDGNIQVLRDGFVRLWRVFAAALEARWFIRQFQPDVLIGDDVLLVASLGQYLRIPVVQIVESFMCPGGPRVIWWQDPPPGMIAPNIAPVWNPLRAWWKLKPITHAEELLSGDLYLIPSIPELDPVPANQSNMHYIGALVRSTSSNEVLPAPLNQRDGKPVIYVTLGGGAGSVGNYRFLQILNEGLGDASWNVIVSVGRRLVLDRLPPAPRNMYYYQWVPGGAVIPQSDLVIFHGGHVTMMEVVRAGIPSIVLPFHSEQEGNGRRLEACAAGRVLCPTGAPDSMRLMRGKWAYGEWATWVQPTSALTPEMLRECVLNVLTDARYRAAAKALSAIAAQYGGAATAVELIQQLCETKNGIKSGDG